MNYKYADSTLKAMSKAQLIDYIREIENTFRHCDCALWYSDALVNELIKQCPNFDFDVFQQKYYQLDKNQKGED